MKSFKKILSLSLVILNIFISIPFALTNDNLELNWYFVKKRTRKNARSS